MGCIGCASAQSNIKIEQFGDKGYNTGEKLKTFDWLDDISSDEGGDLLEIRFKNTRKEFFRKESDLKLKRGDIVVVEADTGHDVGIVSLLGMLAEKQFNIKVKRQDSYVIRKVYRKATPADKENWEKAKRRDYPVLLKSRELIRELSLDMSLGDVEFQGDNRKAYFYYTAENRVDYRELIKRLGVEFNIRVEMKQIGARQLAGKIGGLGSCGRELCCSSWRTNLESVSVSAATKQNLSPNAEKYTGQCGKLKCCLMYELDTYLDSWKDFPEELLEIDTNKGPAYRFKVDVLSKTVWYTHIKNVADNLFALDVQQVKEAIMLNKKGKKFDLSRIKNNVPLNENSYE